MKIIKIFIYIIFFSFINSFGMPTNVEQEETFEEIFTAEEVEKVKKAIEQRLRIERLKQIISEL